MWRRSSLGEWRSARLSLVFPRGVAQVLDDGDALGTGDLAGSALDAVGRLARFGLPLVVVLGNAPLPVIVSRLSSIMMMGIATCLGQPFRQYPAVGGTG